jgi:hypothetical protein
MAESAEGRAPDITGTPGTSETLRRIQAEFLEMPGLRLTEAQASRLWGLDSIVCSALLNALIDAGFLLRTRDGAFMRLDTGTPVRSVGLTRARRSPAA